MHILNPISQSVIEINRQTQSFEYDQICITKDNVQFTVIVSIFFRVVDSLRTAYRLGDMN